MGATELQAALAGSFSPRRARANGEDGFRVGRAAMRMRAEIAFAEGIDSDVASVHPAVYAHKKNVGAREWMGN